MKSYFSLVVAATLLSLPWNSANAQDRTASFIYETPTEFLGTGDFDGDGRADLVIVDKESGRFRLAYQQTDSVFTWVDCRPSGLKPITGFSVGNLLSPKLDALAFTSPDANALTLVDAASASAPSKPVSVAFTAALGPSTLAALDIGGEGNTPLADLFVGSVLNSPDANEETLLRDDGKEFPKIAEATLPGPAVRANRIALKNGQPELLCYLVDEDKGDTLRAEDVSAGKFTAVASVTGLPAGSDYAVGNFRGSPLREFLFYKPGEKALLVRPVEESGASQFQFGAGSSFDLGDPVRRIISLHQTGGEKLLVIFGTGEKAGLYNFDGVKAPTLVQMIHATNDMFSCAAGLPAGFIIFLQPPSGKFSVRYQIFNTAPSAVAMAAFGGLPSLADNDNITIPDIAARISSVAANLFEPGQMKPYTNAIPGTRVTYAMVPIPAGEFTMGSPANEEGRKPDEGPQHKVKISPFWMGKYEVTWNEYELFMYPDEERRTRDAVASDPTGDKLADAVSHPSKPYVEMSFGMGKDGFPAISMTQHGANKYCQWLSAKTGHFYRLPTEAEWEYACRAGTTTTYFFGNDASKLSEYAWFEQNSDFKYQKVGRKKPNPWGLYDMYGNVVEWVLDQYDPNFYQQCAGKGETVDPWDKATKPYPHAVRGGSWDDDPPMCRSAARRGSDRAWKMQDPQLPKSVWYFSDAQWVGFRIVRPVKVPPPEQMQKYWTSGVERD
jgi:formylglycine-generating enzyme required for sulfatase activity